jgi:succinate dehydrogenase/fumarate reductase flavoprotein subunit
MKRRFSRTTSRFHRRAPLQPGAAPDPAWDQPWDVAVLGGGNAALVSALTAADHGARVLLLERAPAVFRGGNSRHTRNVRCAHDAADGYVTGPYPGAELRRDLDGVGSGPSDEALADLTIAESQSVPEWMSEHGVRWQPALRSTLGLARTNRFFLGNVFAAGEIMSGNILSSGYLAGFGMTIGTVWGRIAGREAARHARG